jgi:hypothetical protein
VQSDDATFVNPAGDPGPSVTALFSPQRLNRRVATFVHAELATGGTREI